MSEVAQVEQSTETRKPTQQEKRQDFLKTWVEVAQSDNPGCDVVAAKLGLKVETVRQKSVALRKELPQLPKMPRGSRKNTEADAAFLDSLLQGSQSEGDETDEGESEESES